MCCSGSGKVYPSVPADVLQIRAGPRTRDVYSRLRAQIPDELQKLKAFIYFFVFFKASITMELINKK